MLLLTDNNLHLQFCSSTYSHKLPQKSFLYQFNSIIVGSASFSLKLSSVTLKLYRRWIPSKQAPKNKYLLLVYFIYLLVYLVSQSEQSTRTKDTIPIPLTCQASLTFFFFFLITPILIKKIKKE